MRLLGADTQHPRYKLIYFDARGICEAIRMIFRYANESFIDERLTKKQWLRIKDHTPFGKIPILEYDGKKLGQCYAISRFLARKFNLIGTDEWDQAKADEVSEFHRGIMRKIFSETYNLRCHE
jgi:glutathione S-transferase